MSAAVNVLNPSAADTTLGKRMPAGTRRQIRPISTARHPAHEGAQAQREMFSFLVVNDRDGGRNSNSDLTRVSYARETLGQALERGVLFGFFFFL